MNGEDREGGAGLDLPCVRGPAAAGTARWLRITNGGSLGNGLRDRLAAQRTPRRYTRTWRDVSTHRLFLRLTFVATQNMMAIMPSSPSRKEISHERIVDVASRAIRRAGIRGVGVADMMKEAGLTHGGFYAHFESRDALVVEAMQRAGRDTSAALEAAIGRRTAKGDSRFAALVRAYLHDSHLDFVEGGCVVAALACEMPRLGEPIRDEARRRVTALVELVQSALPDDSGTAQAEHVAAALVGALQLARVLGDRPGRNLLARTREQLIAQFDPASSH